MVCTSVFQDIVQRALKMMVPNPNVNLLGTGTGTGTGTGSGPDPAAPFIQQQQQHDAQLQPMIVFGSGITSVLNPLGTATGVYGGAGRSSSSTVRSSLNPMAEPWAPPTNEQVEEVIPTPEDDRTLFVTFSRGYPIPERDVLDFFVRYTQLLLLLLVKN
ncbi:hypothetical protein BVC80_939g2 [Macleaya cordata]|nr:hypothetical protein BVC80_939g2 [Macleaya cordata]